MAWETAWGLHADGEIRKDSEAVGIGKGTGLGAGDSGQRCRQREQRLQGHVLKCWGWQAQSGASVGHGGGEVGHARLCGNLYLILRLGVFVTGPMAIHQRVP